MNRNKLKAWLVETAEDYKQVLIDFAADCLRVAFMLGLFALILWTLSDPASEASANHIKLTFGISSTGTCPKSQLLCLYFLFVFCFSLASRFQFTFRKTKEAEAKEQKTDPAKSANDTADTTESTPSTNPAKELKNE